MRIRNVVVLCVMAGWCAAPSYSLTELNGDVYDGNGGPLTPGTYNIVQNITVPEGQTLTVQAGTVVKNLEEHHSGLRNLKC